MKPDSIQIRLAAEHDQSSIITLVRSERLNPFDLDWRHFVVAAAGADLVGAAQLRAHADDSRELGSLVVRRDVRGRGIASRLIDALLGAHGPRVFMITGAAFASHYARWGFRHIPPERAPWPVRRNYWLGRLAGIQSFLAGRNPKRLAVLYRLAIAAPWRSQGRWPAM